MMQPMTIIVLGVICFIFIVFIVRAPKKWTQFIGSSAIRLAIGVLFLFFFNVFAANFGLHIPINIFTVLISSILGIFGVGALAAIHFMIL
jgi:inhibitor of the pro-sigma K processing machinery